MSESNISLIHGSRKRVEGGLVAGPGPGLLLKPGTIWNGLQLNID